MVSVAPEDKRIRATGSFSELSTGDDNYAHARLSAVCYDLSEQTQSLEDRI